MMEFDRRFASASITRIIPLISLLLNSRNRTKNVIAFIVLANVMFCWASIVVGQTASGTKRLPQVQAGTVIGDKQATRWNRVLLQARPRIASGDVNSIPESIRQTVSAFDLVILATVAQTKDDSGNPTYVLKEVGAGYCKLIEGRSIVITSDTQRELGANLGFVGRQMLRTNEGQLQNAALIAKSDTTLVFDAPTLLLRNDKHVELITRHFVWVDRRTGLCSALVWLLNPTENGSLSIYQEPPRWFPENMKEDRRVHVDGDHFLLGGIPTDKAFALEDLPPGKKAEWTERAQRVAKLSSYDKTSFQELVGALNECLQSLR